MSHKMNMNKIRIRFWNKEIKDFAKITINDWENTDMSGVISYGYPNILTIEKDDKYDMDISSCFLDNEEKEIFENDVLSYDEHFYLVVMVENNNFTGDVSFGIKLKNEYGLYSILTENFAKKMKIIGNIHKSPYIIQQEVKQKINNYDY